jgi:hypothetical protein
MNLNKALLDIINTNILTEKDILELKHNISNDYVDKTVLKGLKFDKHSLIDYLDSFIVIDLLLPQDLSFVSLRELYSLFKDKFTYNYVIRVNFTPDLFMNAQITVNSKVYSLNAS